MKIVNHETARSIKLTDHISPRFTPVHDVQHIIQAIKDSGTTGAILEIGANAGWTTRELCNAFPDRKIYAMDYLEGSTMVPQQAGERPHTKDFLKYFRQWVDETSLAYHNVIPVQGDSQLLSFKNDCADVDVVFIDGDHSFKGCMADTINAIHWLTSRPSQVPGLIIWHDAYPDAPDWCGVWKVLQSIDNKFGEITVYKDTWVAALQLKGI